MEAGFVLTGRSEENACIGMKTRDSIRKSISDLRRTKIPEVECFDKGHNLETECQIADSASETCGPIEKIAQDSPRDDCSEYDDEPRSVSQWLEWLEDRADVSRKEIQYRMTCQRAFIEEAREKLKSHALAADEFKDIWYPKMQDRLDRVKRQYVQRSRKSSKARREYLIDDQQMIDIQFDDVGALSFFAKENFVWFRTMMRRCCQESDTAYRSICDFDDSSLQRYECLVHPSIIVVSIHLNGFRSYH